MKNIFLITKREYLTQVKKKSFLILTLLAPLLIAAFGAVIGFMFKANKSEYKIGVLDKEGVFSHLKNTENITYTYLPVEAEYSFTSTLGSTDALDGLLILPKIKNGDYKNFEKETELLTNKKISFDTRVRIANEIANELKVEKIKKLGIDQNQLKSFDEPFNLNTVNVKDKKSEDDSFLFGIKSAMSGILMYVTFMFIVIYGVRVMRSVLEEKNNRVVEIIISSVKPFELMAGKILGVTLVALTQFAIWITMTIVAATIFNNGFTNMPMGAGNPLEKIGNIHQILTMISHSLFSLNYGLIIFIFVIYFILGYMFYSAMYAAIGSSVDNETETQQFTIFAILPLMVGMYGSFSIINNPEGPLGFWLSMIPFTSPVAMIARAPFGVPIWQLALSLSLLILSTIGMVYIASKIYRVGILMYGNKASFKEIIKWIRS